MLNAEFFTDTGHHREKNEDAGGIFYNMTEQQLLVLCDGMGGHKAGEVASEFVVQRLKELFEEENLVEEHQAEDWLRMKLQKVNRELYSYALTDDNFKGMGTTAVAALIFDKHAVIANIGDSRAYLVNSREIEQITNDHSFVNHLVMTGQITEEEAFTHPQRNIITRVMGTDKFVVPDIYVKRLNFNDYLLMNSDGLTDFVRPFQIKEQLNQDLPLEAQGQALLELAQIHDSTDNVSLVLAEIEGDRV
ncbi:Stp1/IreP family PP2C-type Ser/Thr phosphatase [Staphylococcus sp. IVB6181]|uniref:Stp1/IreP family PP2C-type Ser/Thr phosphatase n=1 Tax=unclassified Staphylococcus TaxID=91994 RepID=UPI000DF801BF|nr:MULTISPECIES: Stp1/IreP family PP2C-type Ser/Thr phosphatase [unclassified Staphylococcus]UXV34158.1 Stp1/IreP family PP2C-type Ser/Thr phosphatase [Staphylococcus sp. IVB6181]